MLWRKKKEFSVLVLWIFSLQYSCIYYTGFRSVYILGLTRLGIFQSQTLYMPVVKVNQKTSAEIQTHHSFTLLLPSLLPCLFLLLTILSIPALKNKAYFSTSSFAWEILLPLQLILLSFTRSWKYHIKKESCVNDRIPVKLAQRLSRRGKKTG